MKENAPEKSRANVLIILRHFQKWLTGFFYKKAHQTGKVMSDRRVDRKISPVAYSSSPPYFAERSAVVIGAGMPAIITVIPLSMESMGRNAVIAKTTAGIKASLTKV